jgi:NADH dehydrogenase [ubiquinone] 1 alpha subcomplex assembly factor 1
MIASTLILLGSALPMSVAEQTFAEREVLFDFSEQDAADAFGVVNDSVMGGVSESAVLRTEQGELVFGGNVSLENNGGFASMRSVDRTRDLSAFEGLLVRVKGDGQMYSFSVRTDLRIPAGAYYFDFDTRANEWQTIFMPFDAFKPRSFGRELPAAPALNRNEIRSVGVIISDKQAGRFALTVDRIEAVRENSRASNGDRHELSEDVALRAVALIERAIERGVPLFNDGNPAACAAVYEVTSRALIDLAGDELDADVIAALERGLRGASLTDDSQRQAWLLRYSLDAALRDLLDDMPARMRMRVTGSPPV